MEELVYLKRDEAFTDSLVIANGTGNQHATVTKTIRRYRRDFEKFGRLEFTDFVSENPKGGRPSRIYRLNEQQATLLVTFLGNSEIVRDFKVELVRQFFEMRKFIAEKQTSYWMETRQAGMLTRKSETDTIKELVEYAKEQGSTHSDMLYVTYTKLANTMTGVKNRESATVTQLNNLSIFENLIFQMIRNGMAAGLGYKDIYRECKARCQMAQQVAMIGG